MKSTAERIADIVGIASTYQPDLLVGPDASLPLHGTFANAAQQAHYDRIDAQALQALRPKFKRGPISLFGLSIELLKASWDDRHLSLTVLVPDRDTGAPRQLTFKVHFDPCCTEEQLAEAICKSIANVVAHEVAEMLHIRGKRFDPHGRELFFNGPEPLPRIPAHQPEYTFTALFNPEDVR